MSSKGTWFDIFHNKVTDITDGDSAITIDLNYTYGDDQSIIGKRDKLVDNPLLNLPYEIREDIKKDYYEPCFSSKFETYIQKNYFTKRRNKKLQELFNDLFTYSIMQNNHILEYNIMVVLSQISYKYLGTWADMLAIGAATSTFHDLQEIGIRCFENWENKSAYTFLKKYKFSEKWLQDYADDVCLFIYEEGKDSDVLLEENISWEMAARGNNIESFFTRYSSRYGTLGT